MTTSATSARPPRPETKRCLDGCGATIEPVFIEGTVIFGRLFPGTNQWVFDSERCSQCLQRYEEAERRHRVEVFEAEASARRSLRLEKMVSPKGLQEFHLDKYQAAGGAIDAFNACASFNPATDNLYLWGPTGSGKTHLSVGTLRKHFVACCDGIFVKHAALNRMFQGKRSEEYDEELARFVSCSLLVVDDMGTAKQTEFADQVLYEIIDGRYMNYQHGMIITSNLSIRDLAAKLGDDRLTSRIAGGFKVVKCAGRDWRVKGASQ
jgi:DNA replication protein DnaC